MEDSQRRNGGMAGRQHPLYLDYDVLEVNENTGMGLVRFNRIKRLNTVLHLYKDASNYTEWFVPQVERLRQRAVKLFLGWIGNDII